MSAGGGGEANSLAVLTSRQLNPSIQDKNAAGPWLSEDRYLPQCRWVGGCRASPNATSVVPPFTWRRSEGETSHLFANANL